MASFQRSAVFSLVLIMSLLWGFSQAKDVLVGGKTDAWKIPSSESDSLNKWAGNARFLIGDSLVWKYDGQKDSVLQVSKEAYAACNTTNPIEEYKGWKHQGEARQIRAILLHQWSRGSL
ncbi:hypothetical protein OIU78_023382 [Salix suchowensis]|nr:hypothetical protein OIU78_023382 [Salix suchowensis]